MAEVISHVNDIFSSISYRIGSAIIDPGDKWDGFEGVKTVLLTHAHFDHIYGLNELLSLNPEIIIYTNAAGREMLINAKKNLSSFYESNFVLNQPESVVYVAVGKHIDLGDGLVAEAVFTPGHNGSCITWIIGDSIFTGDSYIPGIRTVTNLPGGNKIKALESERLIKELAKGRIVYPGHKV